jgi:hypothetical protein
MVVFLRLHVKKNGGGNQVTALLVTLWDATQG